MRYLLILALIMVIASPTVADQRIIADLSNASRTMHPSPQFKSVPIEPAFEDYYFMLFDVCDAIKIKCLIFPMMGEVENAVAYLNEYSDSIIIYDRRLSPILGYVGANAVIAHEVGHHYCGHLTFRKAIARHEAEAEADRFLGFAMAKLDLGVQLSELIGAYESLGIDKGSKTHPPIERRVKEITSGYYASALEEICPGDSPN